MIGKNTKTGGNKLVKQAERAYIKKYLGAKVRFSFLTKAGIKKGDVSSFTASAIFIEGYLAGVKKGKAEHGK